MGSTPTPQPCESHTELIHQVRLLQLLSAKLVMVVSHCCSPVSGLVLVTDAITAMGLPPGRHTLGQQVIEIQGLHAYVAGLSSRHSVAPAFIRQVLKKQSSELMIPSVCVQAPRP